MEGDEDERETRDAEAVAHEGQGEAGVPGCEADAADEAEVSWSTDRQGKRWRGPERRERVRAVCVIVGVGMCVPAAPCASGKPCALLRCRCRCRCRPRCRRDNTHSLAAWPLAYGHIEQVQIIPCGGVDVDKNGTMVRVPVHSILCALQSPTCRAARTARTRPSGAPRSKAEQGRAGQQRSRDSPGAQGPRGLEASRKRSVRLAESQGVQDPRRDYKTEVALYASTLLALLITHTTATRLAPRPPAYHTFCNALLAVR